MVASLDRRTMLVRRVSWCVSSFLDLDLPNEKLGSIA